MSALSNSDGKLNTSFSLHKLIVFIVAINQSLLHLDCEIFKDFLFSELLVNIQDFLIIDLLFMVWNPINEPGGNFECISCILTRVRYWPIPTVDKFSEQPLAVWGFVPIAFVIKAGQHVESTKSFYLEMLYVDRLLAFI